MDLLPKNNLEKDNSIAFLEPKIKNDFYDKV